MENRGVRGDHGRLHLDHHQLLLRPAAAWTLSAGGGVPWPVAAQRSSSSYTCGYCKREFRSAQALGGHMNVHRRERARLRHYYSHRLPNLNLLPPLYCCTSNTTPTSPAVYSFFSTTAAEVATKPAALEVNLELEVGEGFGDAGLDLELRLGCS
ncbi:uncharacterized protein [Lolium perenne]|uniref:uncharacterized protein n=1 Tax=Lolium perenne TaxID=4522 RepID=UPI0021F50A6D|nr:uncharacterized protein LOC127329962 [Lolium perenne]